jgi:hypothetical protein
MPEPTRFRGVLLTKSDVASQQVSARNAARPAVRVSKADADAAIVAAIKTALEPIEARIAKAEQDVASRNRRQEQLRKLAEHLLDLDEQICKIQNRMPGQSGARIPVRKAYPTASLAEQIEKLGEHGGGSHSRWAGVL